MVRERSAKPLFSGSNPLAASRTMKSLTGPVRLSFWVVHMAEPACLEVQFLYRPGKGTVSRTAKVSTAKRCSAGAVFPVGWFVNRPCNHQ